MILAVNLNGDIMVVGEVPEGLTEVIVDDEVFSENNPLDYRIKIDGNKMMKTPKTIV